MTTDRLLTVEEVSALIGELEGKAVKPATLTFYASQSRRRGEDGELTDHDMPLPADYPRVPREGGGKGPRSVRRPRWRESEIRAWRAAGRRPLPERPRDEAGRYLGTVAS